MRGTAASNCVEMRGFLVGGNARICDSQNAWKYAEPPECELRVCPRTAARVCGTRVGSAWEVRLKCGSSARSRGSAHWWVPYLYGTGTLRVKIVCPHSYYWSKYPGAPSSMTIQGSTILMWFLRNGLNGRHLSSKPNDSHRGDMPYHVQSALLLRITSAECWQ